MLTCLGLTVQVMVLRVLAIEIQPILMLLVQGVVLVIWVRFKYGLSLDPRALMRGEKERPGAVWLMSGGCSCLIRRPTVEAGNELCVKKSLPHLLVLSGCCLPHHLQLFLYFPKGGEKTRMWRQSSASQYGYIREFTIHKKSSESFNEQKERMIENNTTM